MRVLVVRPGPQFSVQDVARGWTKGLRQAGCQVVDFNFDDRLTLYGGAHLDDGAGNFVKAFDDQAAVHLAAKGIEIAAFEFWPDLILIISGFFVPPALYELLRARGMRTVLVCTEQPYELQRELERAALADACVLNDPTHLDTFRTINEYVWYIPHAYDPDIHRPGPAADEARSDFCFVGTGYPSRIGFFEQVDWAGIDVALAGNWQALDIDSPLRKFVAHDIAGCCDNTETVELYRGAKISANLYRREAERPDLATGWAMGPREVELAACQTFFLRDPRGEGDELFSMLPTFDGPADFGDQLRTWLGRPFERVDRAVQARAAVADRTFTNHAKQLLRLLDQ